MVCAGKTLPTNLPEISELIIKENDVGQGDVLYMGFRKVLTSSPHLIRANG